VIELFCNNIIGAIVATIFKTTMSVTPTDTTYPTKLINEQCCTPIETNPCDVCASSRHNTSNKPVAHSTPVADDWDSHLEPVPILEGIQFCKGAGCISTNESEKRRKTTELRQSQNMERRKCENVHDTKLLCTN
jgi:hypothetical protein